MPSRRSIFRWMFLLVLLSATLMVAVNAEEVASEDAVQYEDVKEAVKEETEPVVDPEPEPEPEPVPEPEPEPEPEPVVEAVVSETPASSSSPLDAVKAKLEAGFDVCLTKGKAFVAKCKSLEKEDLTKIAAGALGVWGVGAGIAWLAQDAAPAPTKTPVKGKGRK